MQRFLEEVRYQDAIWTGLQESEAELIFLRVNSFDKPAVVSRVEPIPFGIPHLQEKVCEFQFEFMI